MTNPSTSPDPFSSDPGSPSVTPGATETPTTGPGYVTSTQGYAAEDYPAGAGVGVTSTAGQGGESRSTTDVAKDEAGNVKDTAVQAGKNVADTAKEQAATVAGEAKTQAKSLLQTVSSEVSDQGRNQQQRIASALHSAAKELGSMASSSQESGPMTDLAQQASRRVGEIGHWLENSQPNEILEDVRRFARRRPVAFLAICGLAGVVVGRLTRGAVAANTSLDSPDSGGTQTRALESGYSTPPPVTTYETTSVYDTPSTYSSATTAGLGTAGAPASLVEEDTVDYDTSRADTGAPGQDLPSGTVFGDDTRTDLNR